VVIANETTSAEANIHIGRVGIVENVTVGSSGQVMSDAAWQPVDLVRVSDERAEQFRLAGASIVTRKGEYRLVSRLAQGDFCTLYEGLRGADRVCVKVADHPDDNDLLQEEARVLRLLHSKVAPQTRHVPALLDQFSVEGRAGLVLQLCDGLTLRTLRDEHFPGGIDQRHVLWMTRRCLSTLGLAHQMGLLHGNVAPEHVLVRPHDHNVWLVDWTASVLSEDQAGFRVHNPPWSPPEVAARQPPRPSSDLYALGTVMLWALGDTEVDPRFRRFLGFFIRDSAVQRAQDAWEMYRKLDLLREQMWGPHRFLEFKL
jgi:serine/threonine protein kinase